MYVFLVNWRTAMRFLPHTVISYMKNATFHSYKTYHAPDQLTTNREMSFYIAENMGKNFFLDSNKTSPYLINFLPSFREFTRLHRDLRINY